jgi:hypothetical protein
VEGGVICHCLCFAVHPERGICDVDAPDAILSMDTTGSVLAESEPWAREKPIPMCLPCAEAAMAAHPRARSMVVLP